MAAAEEQKSRTIDDLVTAIRNNKPDQVQEILLTSSIDINGYVKGADNTGKVTPLIIAVQKRSFKLTSALLKAKADPNLAAFPSGDTPLHIASMWAEPKLVEILLAHNANALTANNEGKTPVNIVGSKLKDGALTTEAVDKKSEVQLLLLGASVDAAEKKKKELEVKVGDVEIGLEGLKIESNQRLNAVQKAQGQKFDQMWPYMCCPANRYKVWCVKNTGINEFLGKRYVKVNIPTYVDKDDVQHFNFGKVQDFQKTMAKELLLKGGLTLEPEACPPKFK